VGRQDRSTPRGFRALSTLLDVLARVQRGASVARRSSGTFFVVVVVGVYIQQAFFGFNRGPNADSLRRWYRKRLLPLLLRTRAAAGIGSACGPGASPTTGLPHLGGGEIPDGSPQDPRKNWGLSDTPPREQGNSSLSKARCSNATTLNTEELSLCCL
jgi:hypothetical protein